MPGAWSPAGQSSSPQWAEIAQLVEHATENCGVGSSILPLGTCGSGSVVEHLLAKERVAGSNPVFRSRGLSRETDGQVSLPIRFLSGRRGQVVKAGVCKTPIAGSIPAVASISPDARCA
jgi:hypothetical protein